MSSLSCYELRGLGQPGMTAACDLQDQAVASLTAQVARMAPATPMPIQQNLRTALAAAKQAQMNCRTQQGLPLGPGVPLPMPAPLPLPPVILPMPEEGPWRALGAAALVVGAAAVAMRALRRRQRNPRRRRRR